GFQGEAAERKSTNADGLVQSDRAYRNLAFVLISASGKAVAQVPVEIVADRTVTIPVLVQPEAVKLGELALHRQRRQQRLGESLEVADSAFKELNATVGSSRTLARSKAQATLKLLQADIASLTNERASLQR